MEARRGVEVTGVLGSNMELGCGAQRTGVGAARVVVAQRADDGVWRSPMCSPVA